MVVFVENSSASFEISYLVTPFLSIDYTSRGEIVDIFFITSIPLN
jgi:hypothetical protein